MINIRMQHQEVQKLSPQIAVFGVGGAGCNAVNNMILSGLSGVEFTVCNTDAQSLEGSLCENKIQLGASETCGLGAGSRPEVGQAAAEESLDEVIACLDGANMVFVTAGMGGGTGTGAAPVIARAAREKGILTVGVVTKPFHFEGTHRMKMAENGIREMQQYVDTLIVIPNQNLFRIANEKTTFAEAFKMADSVLQSGVRGVTDLMVVEGLINLDFADIRTAMLEMGKAMMGMGEASGDKRAIEAAEKAINNPLLDDISMKGARGVIINITGGTDMTLFEVDEACNRIREEVDPDANLIFGSTFDETMDGVMRVSVVATGIDNPAEKRSGRPQGQGQGQGQGSASSGTGGSGGFERTQPNETKTAETPEQPEIKVPAQPAQPVQTTQASAGIHIPQRVSGPAAYQLPQSAQLAQPKPAAAVAVQDDPEADMFDVSQCETAQISSGASSSGSETAMRGTRYKDAFIPPAPVMPERSGSGYGPSFAPQQAPAAAQQTAQSQPQSQPQSQSKGGVHGLWGRLTSHLGAGDDAFDDGFGAGQSAPRAGEGLRAQKTGTGASPSQGRLNIDKPAGRPDASADDELDIPAFLRRQAN